jgi:hypothetical protein
LSREIKPQKCIGSEIDTTNAAINSTNESETSIPPLHQSDKANQSSDIKMTLTRPLCGFFQDRKMPQSLAASTRDRQSQGIAPVNTVPKKKLVMDQRGGKSALQFGVRYSHNVRLKYE